jgi:hypothetical protein
MAGLIALGSASGVASATPSTAASGQDGYTISAYCVWTVSTGSWVFARPDKRSVHLYYVNAGSNFYATDTLYSGYGGPFLKGSASGKETGFIDASHLYNKRSCAV